MNTFFRILNRVTRFVQFTHLITGFTTLIGLVARKPNPRFGCNIRTHKYHITVQYVFCKNRNCKSKNVFEMINTTRSRLRL